MKILLSCFACAPNKGSEPGVGWNWAMALSKYNEVWVLTREENRKEIEAYSKKHAIPFHVEYFGIPFFETVPEFPYRKNLYIMIWQKKVVDFAKKLHRMYQFDIVHHVTYASFKYPTQLYKLGIPLFVGPVGGGERTPVSCRTQYSLGYRLIEAAHDFQIKRSTKSRLFMEMCQNAEKLMLTTPETLACIPERFADKAMVMQTIGISEDEIIKGNQVKEMKPEDRLRIAYVGNLLQLKGIRMLPDIAGALNGRIDCSFDIIGDGPEMTYLRKKVQEKGMESRFTFHGLVERKRALQLLRDAHLFFFPSFHDSGGMAVLEAMAVGIPCLVLGTGGPDVHITDKKNGFKVSSKQPYDGVVKSFADQIIAIYDMYIMEPQKLKTVTDHALQYLRTACVWDKKAEQMSSLYYRALQRRG